MAKLRKYPKMPKKGSVLTLKKYAERVAAVKKHNSKILAERKALYNLKKKVQNMKKR